MYKLLQVKGYALDTIGRAKNPVLYFKASSMITTPLNFNIWIQTTCDVIWGHTFKSVRGFKFQTPIYEEWRCTMTQSDFIKYILSIIHLHHPTCTELHFCDVIRPELCAHLVAHRILPLATRAGGTLMEGEAFASVSLFASSLFI